jgi:hypothetical protein
VHQQQIPLHRNLAGLCYASTCSLERLQQRKSAKSMNPLSAQVCSRCALLLPEASFLKPPCCCCAAAVLLVEQT